MSDVEKAIEDLKEYADNSWGGLSDTFDIAIKSLMKELDLTEIAKKCEYNPMDIGVAVLESLGFKVEVFSDSDGTSVFVRDPKTDSFAFWGQV